MSTIVLHPPHDPLEADLTKDIVALARPASVPKPANAALKERGVEVRPLDLTGSQDAMVSALKGIKVLISAVGAREQLAQLELATAAKAAGVKRCMLLSCYWPLRL